MGLPAQDGAGERYTRSTNQVSRSLALVFLIFHATQSLAAFNASVNRPTLCHFVCPSKIFFFLLFSNAAFFFRLFLVTYKDSELKMSPVIHAMICALLGLSCSRLLTSTL